MKTNTEIYKGLGSQLIDHQHSYPGGGTGTASVASVPPDSMQTQVVIRMWSGGPFRHWSATKSSLAPMGYATGGFVGSYVCGLCKRSCEGVYLVREEHSWLCGGCKRVVRGPKAPQSGGQN